MTTKTIILNLLLLASFFIGIVPIWESWKDGKKPTFLKFGPRFIFCTICFIGGVIVNWPAAEKAENIPLIHLAYDDSQIIPTAHNDSIHYSFWLNNWSKYDAYNFHVKIYILGFDKQLNRHITCPVATADIHSLPHGDDFKFNGILKIVLPPFKYDTAFFYLKGSYTNFEKTVTQPIDYCIFWYNGIGAISSPPTERKDFLQSQLRLSYPEF